jgi:hypothetical protein
MRDFARRTVSHQPQQHRVLALRPVGELIGVGVASGEAGEAGQPAERVRPVLFGYQRVCSGSQPDVLACGRRRLLGFAIQEGCTLGEVFVERGVWRPGAASGELLSAARRPSVRAVVGLGPQEVSRDVRVRQGWVEPEAGVLVVGSDS